MDPITLSIVILNYKTKNLLRLILRNLYELRISVPHEVIVIDNASEDGSAEMVRTLYPQVKLIVNSKNLGHARGNNLGIAAARGEFLLVMNTDIIIPEVSDITAILDYMCEHPDVGLVGPQLRNGNGTIQASCFRPYGSLTPFYRRTPLGHFAFAQRDLQRHLMTDFDHESLIDVDWILGACMFVRRSALIKAGAFNENFFLYFADFELCDRLRFYGYRVIYFPGMHIVHYHRRESAQHSVWGGLGSLLNYVTRVHLKDWRTYKRIAKSTYASDS